MSAYSEEEVGRRVALSLQMGGDGNVKHDEAAPEITDELLAEIQAEIDADLDRRSAAARNEGREEGLVQGFADCEALVGLMLKTLSAKELAKAEECAGPLSDLDHRSRGYALAEAALAIYVGQHRTDAYDPEQLATAHRKAAHGDLVSKGGKARALALSPERRREIAQKASDAALTARGLRAKGE